MARDQVAELINKIHNAGAVGHAVVTFGYSELSHGIALALEKEGYLKSSLKKGKKGGKMLEIEINYDEFGKSLVHGVKRLSHLSKRIYKKSRELTPSRGSYEHVILSTPAGVLSDKDARAKHVGGEVLFKIW